MKFVVSIVFVAGMFVSAFAVHSAVDDQQQLNEIRRLRAMGPAGLEEALKRHPQPNPPRPVKGRAQSIEKPSVAVMEWRAFVDAVAGQRDAWASKLYWYTDIEEAKKEAQRTNWPILSLRLLGKLTDEHSCANSRFFRKTLYPNDELSKCLRANYVLHWESVRPVPTVTIDFGDGRTLTRTITGNSIHYILDSQGRLIDALPGLYDPASFKAGLDQAFDLAKMCGSLDDQERGQKLITYHSECITRLDTKLSSLLKTWNVPNDQVKAFQASLLDSYSSQSRREPDSVISPNPADPTINLPMIVAAASVRSNVSNDNNAMQAIRGVERPVDRANAIARPKNAIEMPIVDRVSLELEDFSARRAYDTVQNEYGFHQLIHIALSDPKSSDQSLQQFTEWVYSRLFLSPLDDPWYGLRAKVYDGYDLEPESKVQAASTTYPSIDEKIKEYRRKQARDPGR